jgi:predicted DNA-binding transcriptional regulator YafY
MSKLRRALSLINLLQHRSVVTIKMIGEACGIPRRSAFRFLNELSEANIPLYYDSKFKGYRLNTDAKLSLDNLDLGDSIMIVLALELLGRELNDPYGEEIQHLIQKVCVRQSYALESMVELMQPYAGSCHTGRDHSEQLSFLLTAAGVQFKKKLRITRSDDKHGDGIQEIRDPSLRFQEDWYLVDNKQNHSSTTSLSSINKVTILKQS